MVKTIYQIQHSKNQDGKVLYKLMNNAICKKNNGTIEK